MAANRIPLEPPPTPPQKKGIGCFAKGCLFAVVLGILFLLAVGGAGYFFFLGQTKPAALPVTTLAPEQLSDVEERIDQYKSTPAQPEPSSAAEPEAKRELRLTSAEINGLIAANPRARGLAYVTMSGNTATVRLSIPATLLPGLPQGHLNGTFTITSNGPTPLEEVQISKIEANGMPLPSEVLSWNYRGRSIRSYALDALAPYHVSRAEVRDGVLYAQ
jgi:hypothetical protein